MTRKEAIEVVKERLDYHEREKRLKAACEILIPELTESEDEKIRKEIIAFLIHYHTGQGNSVAYNNAWITYLEKQKERDKCPEYCVRSHCIGCPIYEKEKEQKSAVYTPKFKVGDKVISTENTHLTYDILEVGLINELGKPDYRVEIFDDGKHGIPEIKKEHNIHLIDCQKMDSWAKLIEQKPSEWSEEDKKIIDEILSFFRKMAHGETIVTDTDDAARWHNWLVNMWSKLEERSKSFSPQSHWKPSKEQIEALWETLHPDDPYYVDLSSLYDDLKKLL